MKPVPSAGKPVLGSYNRIDSGENVIRNFSLNLLRLSCQLKIISFHLKPIDLIPQSGTPKCFENVAFS